MRVLGRGRVPEELRERLSGSEHDIKTEGMTSKEENRHLLREMLADERRHHQRVMLDMKMRLEAAEETAERLRASLTRTSRVLMAVALAGSIQSLYNAGQAMGWW